MKKIIGIFLAMTMVVVFVGACAPKKAEGNLVDLKEIHQAIKDSLGEDYIPNQEMSPEMLENFTGVKESDMETYIAEMPMISVSIDTFIAIQAKKGKADEVEAGLENYKKDLVENSMQYPMNIAKVNSAKVIRHGDYIFFLMLGKYDDRDNATEEEALEFAKEEIKNIEDIINKFFQ